MNYEGKTRTAIQYTDIPDGLAYLTDIVSNSDEVDGEVIWRTRRI